MSSHPSATRRVGAALGLALLLGSASPSTRACGYDGMPIDLGLAHPASLEVSLAIHQAYQGGLLAKPLPLAGGFAMRRALNALEKLRGRLPDATGSFNLLLVEPGLWARFDAFEGAWQLTLHTPPPTVGEPVAIVGEGALLAMVGGRLSARQALAAGVLRLDAEPHQAQRWQTAFSASSSN